MKHIGSILLLLTIVSCERQSEDFYLHFENTGDKHICIDYDLGYPVDSLKVPSPSIGNEIKRTHTPFTPYLCFGEHKSRNVHGA